MKLKMSNDDRCAVALLLDRHVSTDGWKNGCYDKTSDESMVRALHAVRGVLKILDHARVEEPPDSLVANTVRRCWAVGTHQPSQTIAGVAQRPTLGH
jgi:hypothetical protein